MGGASPTHTHSSVTHCHPSAEILFPNSLESGLSKLWTRFGLSRFLGPCGKMFHSLMGNNEAKNVAFEHFCLMGCLSELLTTNPNVLLISLSRRVVISQWRAPTEAVVVQSSAGNKTSSVQTISVATLSICSLKHFVLHQHTLTEGRELATVTSPSVGLYLGRVPVSLAPFLTLLSQEVSLHVRYKM